MEVFSYFDVAKHLRYLDYDDSVWVYDWEKFSYS